MLRFISILGVCLQRFLACACVICMWGFSVASSGSFSGQQFFCVLCVRAFTCPSGFAWLSVQCVGTRVLSSISLPSSPYPGESGPLLYSFSIERTVQYDGCLIWGLVWQAGLVAGLRVGQAYGVFHRPGFESLVPVPRSLSTQPPFATQARIISS